jgi:hypothetical protein
MNVKEYPPWLGTLMAARSVSTHSLTPDSEVDRGMCEVKSCFVGPTSLYGARILADQLYIAYIEHCAL